MTKLPKLSQIEFAKVYSDEPKNDNRTTGLRGISALRAKPWPGYNELAAAEIQAVLGKQPRKGRARL